MEGHGIPISKNGMTEILIFSKKELQQQLKKMMRNYNIPSSSRNFSRKYGRKPRRKSRKTIGYR